MTEWPKPENASFTGMFAELVAGDGARTTESDAVDAYIQQLGAGNARWLKVAADAERHIQAAYALAGAADAAATSVRPTKNDISVVEDAIGDLRSTRDIYAAALRRLADEGESVDPNLQKQLRASFSEAITEIGAAADRLSESISEDRNRTLAGDEPRRRTANEPL